LLLSRVVIEEEREEMNVSCGGDSFSGFIYVMFTLFPIISILTIYGGISFICVLVEIHN